MMACPKVERYFIQRSADGKHAMDDLEWKNLFGVLSSMTEAFTMMLFKKTL